MAAVALTLLAGPMGTATAADGDPVRFEAEGASTSYTGNAGRVSCGSCSGGAKVGNLYGDTASFTMHDVSVPTSGEYEITIGYLTGDPRTVELSVNGGPPTHLSFEPSGGWDVVATTTLAVTLREGTNTLSFASAGAYSPDFDYVDVPGAVPPEPPPTTFEAEAGRNLLSGGAHIAGCADCSEGQLVTGLVGDAALTFTGIAVDAPALRKVELSYVATEDRAARLSINGKEFGTLSFPATGGEVDSVLAELPLEPGNNELGFTAVDGPGPDLDVIAVPGAKRAPLEPLPTDPNADDPVPTGSTPVGDPGTTVRIHGGGVTIHYHLGSGTADARWPGSGRPAITGFYSGVRLDSFVTTKQYAGGCSFDRPTTAVTCRAPGLPTLRQHFTFDGGKGFFVRLEVLGEELSSNMMVPVAVDDGGSVDIGTNGDHRVLLVPVDNDHWVRYEARPSTSTTTAQRSFEVTSFYDNQSRRGFVVGSVDRDQWKSGIVAEGDADGRLDRLQAAAGLTDWSYDYGSADNRFQFNREWRPHQEITGDVLRSPRIFVGYYDDWRMGMETFARHVADVVDAKTWDKGTPFGFNSWGGLGARGGTPEAMEQTSDFIAEELPGFRNTRSGAGPYVGIDSYWDKMIRPEYAFERPDADWSNLEEYVAHVRANGQQPALYFQPFAHFWQEGLDSRINGTALCDGCPNQTLRQMALKVNGRPVQIDGAWALDPTNPGVINRDRIALQKFREMGVRYVKLDFLTHAYVEADRWFDPDVTTGVEAFHQGMGKIDSFLGDETFVDVAISPLFMAEYAHARRISCDVHGAMNNWDPNNSDRYQKSTEYLLNSVTYGWWLDDLYAYNDGDHIQFGNYYYDSDANARLFEDPYPRVWPKGANRARVTSAVITGVYLISEDYTEQGDPLLRERAKEMLQNPAVNRIAEIGRTFRPVEADTGFKANELFVLHHEGTSYLAVFNFRNEPTRFAVDLRRLGLSTGEHQFTELWSGDRSLVTGSLRTTVPPEDVRLYKITGD